MDWEPVFYILAACIGVAIIRLSRAWACTINHRYGEGARNLNRDEAQVFQDMHSKLNRLEDRIESLETILTSSEKQHTGRP